MERMGDEVLNFKSSISPYLSCGDIGYILVIWIMSTKQSFQMVPSNCLVV